MKWLEGVKGKCIFLIQALFTFIWNPWSKVLKLFVYYPFCNPLPLYVTAPISSNTSLLTPCYPNHLHHPVCCPITKWYCMSSPPFHGAAALCSLPYDNLHFSNLKTLIWNIHFHPTTSAAFRIPLRRQTALVCVTFFPSSLPSRVLKRFSPLKILGTDFKG